jgi:hypothetical protein
MTGRASREISIDGRRVRLVDAWRAPGGLGLGYFLADSEDPKVPADRRTELPPGTAVDDLSEEDVLLLWENAAPLTATEARFEDSAGESWLAQATGPAWSETGAADAVGVRIVCLTADRETVECRGLRLSELGASGLRALVDPLEE